MMVGSTVTAFAKRSIAARIETTRLAITLAYVCEAPRRHISNREVRKSGDTAVHRIAIIRLKTMRGRGLACSEVCVTRLNNL